MKRALTISLLLWVAWTAGSARGWVPDRKALDQESAPNLQGTWNLVHIESDGAEQKQTLTMQYRWVITAETITIMMQGQDRGSWTYQLKAKPDLSELDLTPRNTFRAVTYPSAFRLEGDRLTVCLQSFPKRGRPSDLISRPNSGVGKFVFERMK